MNRQQQKYSRLGLETLEGRCLMASGLMASPLIGLTAGAKALVGSPVAGNVNAAFTVDLSGKWFINGQTCTIIQSGNSLTFINERGERSAGYFLQNGQVVATDWGNLVGTLSNNNTRITWANGSTWDRTPMNLSGRWLINGRPCQIIQSGNTLIFINERGQRSPGYFLPNGQVVATGWGNLTGTLSQNNTRITWANGSVWNRQSPVG